MSQKSSEGNHLSSSTLRAAMGENPLPSSSSSTFNPSLHGSLPSSYSTLNPPASSIHGNLLHSYTLRPSMGENPLPSSSSSTFNRLVHGTLLPSSSSTFNPANSIHGTLLPSSSSTFNHAPSIHGTLLPFSSYTFNHAPSIHGRLLPSSSTRNPSFEVGQSSSSREPFSYDPNTLSTQQISITPSSENHTTFAGTLFPSIWRPRFKWSADLHRRFLDAVEFLGGERSATPRAILDLINEKDLTLQQVSSHLQTHRNSCFAKQQAAKEAEAEAEAAAAAPQMGLAGNGGSQTDGPLTLYIDPVGPMPPSIPPSMRAMNFSAPQQETLLFEELYQDCRQKPADEDDDDDEEGENVTLELMPGSRREKRPKIDLTLTIKPPTQGSPDSSRPHA